MRNTLSVIVCLLLAHAVGLHLHVDDEAQGSADAAVGLSLNTGLASSIGSALDGAVSSGAEAAADSGAQADAGVQGAVSVGVTIAGKTEQ